jgi:hypothetical protein
MRASYELPGRAARGAGEDARVLPLPPVLDTPAVALLHLLAGRMRPVVLDAAELREVRPDALRLLEALFPTFGADGSVARIVNLGRTVRGQLRGSPLLAAATGRAWSDDDGLFTSPDLDDTGFVPSER